MSRGPPHRFNPTGERSFRGYPPIARYGEFSGSSSYYYSGPPYKRQRRLSEDDLGPPGGSYGPAYYDPPYVRHQEVGLGDFNDFSSISGKDIKIERDGAKKDHERSELQPKKRQTSTEGSGYSLSNRTDSAPSSPHSKVSPRFSPRRPTTPPLSLASQPLLITTSQVQSSKAPLMTSPNDASSFSKQHSIQLASSTSSQPVTISGTNMQEKLKDVTGRPAPISLLPSGGGQKKDSYPGPAVEAISPSAPASEVNDEEKKTGKDDQSDLMSKDELLQSMEKVDREITQVEQQINNLKKKQKQLEEEASKQPIEAPEEEAPLPEPKPKSVVQMIYEENKKKAETAAARLAKLSVPLPGGKPLYNQPSDLPCYHENLRRGPAVKAKLVKYFQLRKQAKELKNRQLCKEYKTLKQAWLKKIERNENNPKRKQKEAKLREFYEKVFPEIKKQREQTERFTRMGSRSNWGIVARSEAEFNEIVDNLNEQEANERHMRTLAVEPPPMLDKEERRVKFINRNGLIRDPLATLNERKHKNIWTEKERRIFKDKFIQNPKDFDLIASFLPGKSVSDCILFYYQTKKKEHYKQLSRRHNLKKRRRDQTQFGSSRECPPTNKARTSASESSAKGERGGSDGEEDLEEITDSAEESDENNEHAPPPVTTAQVTTPTPSVRHTGRPDHVETSRWSEKEIEIALQGLRECGRDWEAIAQRVVTKTGAQCKNFYFNYKKKLHLEALVAEHEATKMQRAQQQQQQRQSQQQQQQQQQHRNQQQLQTQPQRQPPEHQRDNPNVMQKREPAPKKNVRPQTSDSYSSLSSNPHNKPTSASTDNAATTGERESTSVIVGSISTPEEPPGNAAPTATSPLSIASLQLVAPRIVPSHSPHLPLTSSSSTLFMPTPGVIASIGRASPSVGTGQPAQVYFRPSLPESTKHDTPHSRSSHPEAIFPGLVYPRAVDPRVLQSDPSHLRPSFLVSSRPGHPHSDAHPLYQGSAVPKPLGYTVDPQHSSALHSSSSSSSLSNKGDLQGGLSHPITSHPGISHTGKSHVGDSYGHSSHASEPSHTPTSSSLFASSGPPVSVISNRVPARPTSNSPVPVVAQTTSDHREKPHSQVPIISERSTGHPIKPPYPNTYPVLIRVEPASRSILSDDGKRDVSDEVRGVSERPYAADTRKPDVIVIDADDQKKRMEGLHRLETSEGKQASSMLRMLASGGTVPTSSAEHMPQTIEPVRPQSLPLSSGNRVISHTELRSQQSATPPCSLASRQQTLNPPPPLIQMSSSRDKKYVMAPDLILGPSRSREGVSHTEAHHDQHLHVSQETTAGRDTSRHTHTPVDSRGGDREKRTSVVETVDLTRDREVSTSSLARPTARSPGVALVSSSARATLQAMARYALAETSNADVTEKIEQKKKDDTYLPPRQPDPKLSVYEQNEAIRKFTALSNVCVSAPREVPAGGEYPSQPYALMAMQPHYQPHVHTHPGSSSTPPPYGYPFHVGHPMAGFHHHPEHRFLVPVGVHQLPVREMLPQSVNGEDLPSHLKLSGAYTHQYPQGAAYYPPPGMRSIVPTYQQVTVCGHRYPVAVGEERRALHQTHDVPLRRQNEISEQELANPFVVKPPRNMQAPGMPERVVSPGELPKFPLPSRSPKEPAKRPHTTSPEIKPQIATQAEVAKTVSPPAGNYLSRKPSRPTSVSEMRNRAAVIPDLTGTEEVGQKFPDPQPVVLVPSSKLSGREKPFRSASDEFIRGDGTGQGTKERAREENAGPLAEGLPMSAFATLVDVAAAARKVDVPIEERTPQKGTTELQETYDSPSGRLGGHTMVASPPSPSRTSPGMSSTPRYGITTGLVPKPPPLMPITGKRPLHDGSSSSSTPISISTSGHGNVSRSPSKLTSPPGTRSTRASVSPEGPPPLISRPTISPTSIGSPQGTSPKGPPPLIKGIVSTVPPALRSPEREADSTRKTRSNLEDVTFLRRPDHEDSVSRGPFPKGIQHVDVDFQQKFSMHFPESGPASSQKVDGDIRKNRSLTPHAAGEAQVRTIFETITYVDSGLAEGRHPSRHQLTPYQPTYPMCAEEKDRRVSEMSRSRTPETEQYKNVPSHLQPERPSKDQTPNADQREKQTWQVNQPGFSFQQESQADYGNENFSLPHNEPTARAEISRASGSETEEGDEGDEETEDEVPPVHSSSATLHPRIRALTRSSQSNVQSPYYDASDSETLSAEESEVPPESSDELFPSTTARSGTQSDSSSDNGKDDENERIACESNDTADTGHASGDETNVPGSSRDYSDDEDEQAQKCVLEEVTSTGPLSVQVFDVSTEEPTVDSPTTSTVVKDTEEIRQSPDADATTEREMEISDGPETREVMVAESSPGKIAMEDDSSEALPAQMFRSFQEEDVVRVDSSEDGLVGSSETDKAAIVLRADSSNQQSLQITPDSSASLENRPDESLMSPSESIDNYGQNVQGSVASTLEGDSTTAAQSASEVQGEVLPDISVEQSTWTLEKEEDLNECPSTSTIEREGEVSSMLEEDINEADALEKPSAEQGFLHEPDTYSSSSENHHPEISSAVDCVSDDGEQVPFDTFVGAFVPLPGGVDSPDIKSGCSTHIPSEENSVCGDILPEREAKDAGHLASPKQDVLSPDEGVRDPVDTLSAGEIPPSQDSSPSEDEHLSLGKKVTSVLANEPINIPQSTWHSEESHLITDDEQRASQSKEIEEGEIPESEDEPTVEPSQGSPSDTVRVSSTLTGGDEDTSAEDKVSSSHDVTLHTDCYINMIPISPAPPESPNHQSQGDRTSPLPPWPPIESQYSPVVPCSLSLAARMTSKGTPFPYSTLSINVGSASSSARSSPVPQSLAVNMAPGSSPSSASLLPRPQEPTPLLSDNYEPLSDDEDDKGLADSSNTSDEHNI